MIKMIENEYKGKLIVFEGLDGSGKTTLINIAKNYLLKNSKDCYVTKMPSDRIREIDVFRNWHDDHDHYIRNTVNRISLIIMVSGDRLLVQDLEVIPALKNGSIVICDRYCFSGLTFSNDKLVYDICERFIKPDLTVLTVASMDTVFKRVKARHNERNNFYDYNEVMLQNDIYMKLANENDFTVISTEESEDICEEKLIKSLSKVLESS